MSLTFVNKYILPITFLVHPKISNPMRIAQSCWKAMFSLYMFPQCQLNVPFKNANQTLTFSSEILPSYLSIL